LHQQEDLPLLDLSGMLMAFDLARIVLGLRISTS